MASAETASVTAEKTMQVIKKEMQEMNRPELLRKLGLPWDTTMVVDIEGLHPVTLYQKSTLHIPLRTFPGNSRENLITFFSSTKPITFPTEIDPAILLVDLIGIKLDLYVSRNWLRPYTPHGNA